jgi:hypothetical protein
MKFLIIMVLSFCCVANAKKCEIPLSAFQPNSSFFGFKTSTSEFRDVPDGNCKLVKQEVLVENNYDCEAALDSINSVISNSNQRYTCALPALGLSKKNLDGQYSESIYAICYVCKTK